MHPFTFNGVDLLFCCEEESNVKTICPPGLCVKFPSTTITAPDDTFKLALFFKFPTTNVVVFPLNKISPVFVSVPLFGVKLHVQSPSC